MQGYNNTDAYYKTISIDSTGIKLGVYKTGESDNYGDWSRVPGFVTNKSVDLTPWSKIRFTANIPMNAANYAQYHVDMGYLIASSSSRKLSRILGAPYQAGNTYEFNVSSLTGHYFIGLLQGVIYNRTDLSNVYITKIEFLV